MNSFIRGASMDNEEDFDEENNDDGFVCGGVDLRLKWIATQIRIIARVNATADAIPAIRPIDGDVEEEDEEEEEEELEPFPMLAGSVDGVKWGGGGEEDKIVTIFEQTSGGMSCVEPHMHWPQFVEFAALLHEERSVFWEHRATWAAALHFWMKTVQFAGCGGGGGGWVDMMGEQEEKRKGYESRDEIIPWNQPPHIISLEQRLNPELAAINETTERG